MSGLSDESRVVEVCRAFIEMHRIRDSRDAYDLPEDDPNAAGDLIYRLCEALGYFKE